MRRIKRRSAEKSIAVIIDGKDEKMVPGNDKGALSQYGHEKGNHQARPTPEKKA